MKCSFYIMKKSFLLFAIDISTFHWIIGKEFQLKNCTEEDEFLTKTPYFNNI